MSDVTLSEGIYVRRTVSQFGTGMTSREGVLESFWFPRGIENGYAELYPVTDDLGRVLKILERVPLDEFQKEYALKEGTKDVYLKLKNMVG